MLSSSTTSVSCEKYQIGGRCCNCCFFLKIPTGTVSKSQDFVQEHLLKTEPVPAQTIQFPFMQVSRMQINPPQWLKAGACFKLKNIPAPFQKLVKIGQRPCLTHLKICRLASKFLCNWTLPDQKSAFFLQIACAVSVFCEERVGTKRAR